MAREPVVGSRSRPIPGEAHLPLAADRIHSRHPRHADHPQPLARFAVVKAPSGVIAIAEIGLRASAIDIVQPVVHGTVTANETGSLRRNPGRVSELAADDPGAPVGSEVVAHRPKLVVVADPDAAFRGRRPADQDDAALVAAAARGRRGSRRQRTADALRLPGIARQHVVPGQGRQGERGEEAEERPGGQRPGGAEEAAPRDTHTREAGQSAGGGNNSLAGEGTAARAGRQALRRRWRAALFPRSRRSHGPALLFVRAEASGNGNKGAVAEAFAALLGTKAFFRIRLFVFMVILITFLERLAAGGAGIQVADQSHFWDVDAASGLQPRRARCRRAARPGEDGRPVGHTGLRRHVERHGAGP